MADKRFELSGPGRDPRNSKEASAAKAVARASGFGPALLRHLYRLAGEDGRDRVLDVRYLSDDSLRFPADLVAARVKPFEGGHLLRAFSKTPAYAAWVWNETYRPTWGPPGRRALTFSVIKWGRLVLHDMHELPSRPATFVVEAGAGRVLYLDAMAHWVPALEWRPRLGG